MLVVLLGLPVAPVWCELACPQGHGVAVQAAPAGAPCHEASAGSSVPPGDGPALAAPVGGCDHPTTVSARLPDVRVVAPVPSTTVAASYLAPFAPAAAGRLTVAAVRGPAPPRGPTFSPVLRI